MYMSASTAPREGKVFFFRNIQLNNVHKSNLQGSGYAHDGCSNMNPYSHKCHADKDSFSLDSWKNICWI